ncbi:MAG TPA: C1 family peptidase [Pyrinomonadaceae bacterium]|jgi:C1A family cysteine protease
MATRQRQGTRTTTRTKTTTKAASKSTASAPTAIPDLTSKTHFQPIEKIRDLIEYKAAGLRESDVHVYLPSLGVNTVEEFLGLIRGSSAELAADLGTSEEQLIDIYNAAVSSQLPAMSSEQMDDLAEKEFSFGLSLEAPPFSFSGAFALDSDLQMDLSSDTAARLMTTGQPILAPAAENSKNLIDQYMPPIRDQGDRGTCVAFSTVAVMEYAARRAGFNVNDLSEQYLYWAVKQIDQYPKDGTWLEFSFPVAKQQGTCLEDLWRYESDVIPGDLTHGNPPNPEKCAADALTHAFRRAIRIRNYRQPDAIKEQLRQDRLVAIAIPVFKSWYKNPASRLTGKIHLPLQSDRFALNGHAIVLVGYVDDANEPGGGYFIVRNSWGTENWGSESPFGAGYGLIHYAYIERFNADAWTGEN